MNITGAVEALRAVAEEQEMHGYKIGYVTGDDLLDQIPRMIAEGCEFKNMDDVGDFNEIKDKLVNANVYFGREPIYGLHCPGRRHRHHRPGRRHVPCF